jgi:hypothetical protein
MLDSVKLRGYFMVLTLSKHVSFLRTKSEDAS